MSQPVYHIARPGNHRRTSRSDSVT